MMINDEKFETVTVKAFCERIGISISRLYALWHRHAGPPRVVTAIDAYETAKSAYSALSWSTLE